MKTTEMTPDDERDYKATLALITSLDRRINQLTMRVDELSSDKVPQVQCTLRHQEADKRLEIREQNLADCLKQYVPKSAFAVAFSVLLALSVFIGLLVNTGKLTGP